MCSRHPTQFLSNVRREPQRVRSPRSRRGRSSRPPRSWCSIGLVNGLHNQWPGILFGGRPTIVLALGYSSSTTIPPVQRQVQTSARRSLIGPARHCQGAITIDYQYDEEDAEITIRSDFAGQALHSALHSFIRLPYSASFKPSCLHSPLFSAYRRLISCAFIRAFIQPSFAPSFAFIGGHIDAASYFNRRPRAPANCYRVPPVAPTLRREREAGDAADIH